MRYSYPEASSSIAGNDKEPGSPSDGHVDAVRRYSSEFTIAKEFTKYITD